MEGEVGGRVVVVVVWGGWRQTRGAHKTAVTKLDFSAS